MASCFLPKGYPRVSLNQKMNMYPSLKSFGAGSLLKDFFVTDSSNLQWRPRHNSTCRGTSIDIFPFPKFTPQAIGEFAGMHTTSVVESQEVCRDYKKGLCNRCICLQSEVSLARLVQNL